MNTIWHFGMQNYENNFVFHSHFLWPRQHGDTVELFEAKSRRQWQKINRPPGLTVFWSDPNKWPKWYSFMLLFDTSHVHDVNGTFQNSFEPSSWPKTLSHQQEESFCFQWVWPPTIFWHFLPQTQSFSPHVLSYSLQFLSIACSLFVTKQTMTQKVTFRNHIDFTSLPPHTHTHTHKQHNGSLWPLGIICNQVFCQNSQNQFSISATCRLTDLYFSMFCSHLCTMAKENRIQWVHWMSHLGVDAQNPFFYPKRRWTSGSARSRLRKRAQMFSAGRRLFAVQCVPLKTDLQSWISVKKKWCWAEAVVIVEVHVSLTLVTPLARDPWPMTAPMDWNTDVLGQYVIYGSQGRLINWWLSGQDLSVVNVRISWHWPLMQCEIVRGDTFAEGLCPWQLQLARFHIKITHPDLT